MTSPAVVVAGEGMIELSRHDAGWQVHYGGDTLNIAIHLARFGFSPAYLTALGDDPFSQHLRDTAWPGEGIDVSMILTDPSRSPGLYGITTEPSGERRFTYWRRDSAASALFAQPGVTEATARCEGSKLFVFSLISLAILDDFGRQTLLDLAAAVRSNGGTVAFDGNFRPKLWSSRDEACVWRDRAIALTSIGLPTIDDEIALSGPRDADAIASYWQALGCDEVVVKLGADGCRLPDGSRLPPPEVLRPIDTSGAGDAFDAGYLAERTRGRDPDVSAARGHELAGWVVMRRGAIPPNDDQAPYDPL